MKTSVKPKLQRRELANGDIELTFPQNRFAPGGCLNQLAGLSFIVVFMLATFLVAYAFREPGLMLILWLPVGYVMLKLLGPLFIAQGEILLTPGVGARFRGQTLAFKDVSEFATWQRSESGRVMGSNVHMKGQYVFASVMGEHVQMTGWLESETLADEILRQVVAAARGAQA